MRSEEMTVKRLLLADTVAKLWSVPAGICDGQNFVRRVAQNGRFKPPQLNRQVIY